MANIGSCVDVVLSRYSKIEVAGYQRNYEWPRPEVNDFWSEIRRAADSGEESFIGCVIIEENDGGSCQIVDGQQRVTTLFLIMARLRDEARVLSVDKIPRSSSSDRVVDVAQNIENFLYGSSTKAEPRFIGNSFISVLAEVVMLPCDGERDLSVGQSVEMIKMQSSYRNAYLVIRDLVRDDINGIPDEVGKLSRLNDLYTAITKRLMVSALITRNPKDSLEIFISLNSRSVPLSQFDNGRAQLLSAMTRGLGSKASAKASEKIEEESREIRVNIGGVNADGLIRHYLLANHCSSREVTGKKGIQRFIYDSIESGLDASEMWKGMYRSSFIYKKLNKPDTDTVSGSLMSILDMATKSHKVIGLRIFDPAAGFSPKQIDELSRLLFVATISWFIDGRNAGEFESIVSKIARENFRNRSPQEAMNAIASIICTPDVEGYISHSASGRSKLIRPILMAIETNLSGKASGISHKSMHLEHIAPKVPTDYWMSKMGVKDHDEYSSIAGGIGNVTILDAKINMSIQQQCFQKKCAAYRQSRPNMTSDLALLKEWDSKMISERKAWVIDCLKKMLLITPRKIINFSDWVAMRNDLNSCPGDFPIKDQPALAVPG